MPCCTARRTNSGNSTALSVLVKNFSTRSHCAPLMHEALGTVEQGAVRFSFSHYNMEEEIDEAIRAVKELAEE